MITVIVTILEIELGSISAVTAIEAIIWKPTVQSSLFWKIVQKIKVYGKILHVLSYNIAGNFMPCFMPVFHVVEWTSFTFCGFFVVYGMASSIISCISVQKVNKSALVSHFAKGTFASCREFLS